LEFSEFSLKEQLGWIDKWRREQTTRNAMDISRSLDWLHGLFWVHIDGEKTELTLQVVCSLLCSLA
jgi:hypothetical protein